MGNAMVMAVRERKTLARSVASYRRAYGLSRSEMARLLGVTERTVVALEMGTGGVAPRTLRAWRRLSAAAAVTRDAQAVWAACESEPDPALTRTTAETAPPSDDCLIYQHITGGRAATSGGKKNSEEEL